MNASMFSSHRTRLAAALMLAFGGTMAAGADSRPYAPIATQAARAAPDDAATTPRYALHNAARVARSALGALSPTHARPVKPFGGNTLPVTSCADDGGDGTLRSVIMGAGEGDTIDLSQLTCSTITLTQGVIDISVLGTHHVNDLAIVGPGASLLTIDGNNNGQVLDAGDFQVGLGTLSISDVTIAHGNYTHGLASCIDSTGNVELTRTVVTYCEASGGGPLTFGGAISASYLTMTQSTISQSTSVAAGDNVAIGGGAYVADDAVLVQSTISANEIYAPTGGDGVYYLTAGGGLYVRGALTISQSTIDGNEADAGDGSGLGGGIFVRGDASISDSAFINAYAGRGGGLYKAVYSHFGDPGTVLTIANTTFTANYAHDAGAGLVTTRPTTISNSTIAANTSTLAYGGVFCSGDCTIELESTIIAKNVGDVGGSPGETDFGADAPLVVSGANNLVLGAGANVTLPGDTLAADPLLLPLADNGGPTQTLALDVGSPAIDSGNDIANLPFDQRGAGFVRVSGVAADIGAFEVQSAVVTDRIFANGFD